MYQLSLQGLLTSQGMIYGIAILAAILLLFFLLSLPGILRGSARPEEVIRAAFYCLGQSLGILLMIAGSLPALEVAVSREIFSSSTYMGLLCIFALGGLLFLGNDVQLKSMSAAAKEVPEALYFYTWKFAGLLILLGSGILLVLNLLFSSSTTFTNGSWMIYVIIFFYGLIISFFTLHKSALPSFGSKQTRAVSPSPFASASKKKVKKASK